MNHTCPSLQTALIVRRSVAFRRGAILAVFLAVFLFAFASTTSAQITFDAAASNSDGFNSTLSWSHAVGGGNNRILVVSLVADKFSPFTPALSVTYGGQPLTPQVVTGGDHPVSEIWTLVAPPTGTATVLVSYPDARPILGGSVSFFGVDQTNPIRGFSQARGGNFAGLTLSTSVTTEIGDVVIDVAGGAGALVSGGPDGAQTLRWSAAISGSFAGGSSTKPGAAGSTIMTWNFTAALGISGALSVISLMPARPSITKAFNPATIKPGGTSIVTLTLSNPHSTPLTNASFTDTLTNMSAVGGAVGGSCGGTTPSALGAGATNLSFSGITIPANSSCTVTFSVTSSTAGTRPNQTSGVTTAETPTAGNQSNIVNLTVCTNPTITCPGSITKFTDSGQNTATINPGNPVVTGGCSPVTVKGVRSDGKPLNAPYPIGTTIIRWTATDAVNNSTSCSQTIMVVPPSSPRRRPSSDP